MAKSSFLIESFLIIGIIFLQTANSTSQENSNKSNDQSEKQFTITYVGQFTSEIKNNKKASETSELYPNQSKKKNWFSNLIFGKKPSTLIRPMTLLANTPDSLWIFDQGNGAIVKAVDGVGEITQFKNNKDVIFPSLVGSCFLSANNILFTDSKLNAVFIIDVKKNTFRILNDSLHLDKPTGIAYSIVNKEIWVVETNSHRIAVLNEKGEIIKYVGHRGNAPGEFNFPTFIWIDNLGIIYVIDTLNSRVQMFNSDGELIGIFGEAGDAFGSFARPKGIATDTYGHIYVADALFNNVQIFDKTGKLLSVFGTKGVGREELLMPVGLYIDNKNYIYLADSYNARIQIFKLEVSE
ncbi:MAG TPA: 6-bladed beta-propeller [Draconibacterium sp.]|nr:6-bladed beta-propeller [Draconibacterium sp.]